MCKSQFNKNYPCDHVCGPGSHIAYTLFYIFSGFYEAKVIIVK